MAEIRINVDEVKDKLDAGERVFFIDSRNPRAWADADTKLPEAIHLPADEVDKHIADIPCDRLVVTYCT